MSGRVHSKPKRLATVILARIAGVGEAASVFGVDQDTVRSWVKGAEPVPDDAWAALDELAGAQLLEKVARGDIKNPVTLATVRGIASRNRRYGELIAAREARKVEAVVEPPSPIRLQLDRLDDRRRILVRMEIDVAQERRALELDPEPAADDPNPDPERIMDGGLPEYVDGLLALSDEEVDARTAALKAELREMSERWRERFEAEMAERNPPPPSPVDRLAAALNVTPTPEQAAEAVSAPPERVPMVIDVGRGEPWYDMDTGERRQLRW